MQRYPAYKDSFFEWLGKIPSHWEEKRAKWYFDKIDERSEAGDEELLSVSHITGVTPRSEKNVTMFQAESYEGHKLCQPGDLVINSMWAWMAALGVSQYAGIVSSAYGVYRPKRKDFFNSQYLDYLMRIKGYAGEYLCRSKGIWSSRLLLGPDAFFNIPIIHPPLEDQDAIVAFLEEQTAVINQFLTNKRRLIALLEEQKQVVINTAVTQGLDTAVARKPSGIDWLGDIPAHWTEIKLSRVSKIFNGTTPSRNRPDYWEGNIPWISSGKVNDFVVRTPSEYVTEKALAESSISLVPKGAVIIGMIGQGKTRGLSALLEIEACINQNLAAIVPNHRLDGKYLHYFLLASYEFIREYGRGGNQEALNCQIISSFQVPLPPLSEQYEIVRHIEQKAAEINTAIERTQREIELIEEYRTTLIATAVTGKIDVRTV